MTTQYAPPAIPSLDTGTCPREWTESVLASSPTNDTPATFPETKRTPGDTRTTEEKPRKEPQLAEQQTQTPTTTRDRGTKAEQKQRVSLPSTELRGARPSECSAGVGALPGNLSESSVALLPDEREERAQEHRPTPPRQRGDTITPSAVGGGDEPGTSEREKATTPRDADQPVTSQPADAPTKSTEAKAKTSNVAASSGPDVQSQKEAGETTGQQERGIEKGPEKDIGGSNLGSEDTGQGKGPSQDVGDKEGQPAPVKVKGGYGGDYHPAQLHPPPPGASAAECQSSLGPQHAAPDVPTTNTDKRASASGEKKPGFMTIMKGEMKIFAGKVSGDEHKVEEGKKIVHGEA